MSLEERVARGFVNQLSKSVPSAASGVEKGAEISMGEADKWYFESGRISREEENEDVIRQEQMRQNVCSALKAVRSILNV